MSSVHDVVLVVSAFILIASALLTVVQVARKAIAVRALPLESPERQMGIDEWIAFSTSSFRKLGFLCAVIALAFVLALRGGWSSLWLPVVLFLLALVIGPAIKRQQERYACWIFGEKK